MSDASTIRPCPRNQRAFSSVELVIVLAIGAMLAAIAVPAYRTYVLRAKVSAAITDIATIASVIQRYSFQNLALPADLTVLGYGGKLDPWGNPYYYLPFDGLHGHGSQRKDKNLVPINSDYDLYSAGPDGETRTPLTAQASRDDIIRANDGDFIGTASDY